MVLLFSHGISAYNITPGLKKYRPIPFRLFNGKEKFISESNTERDGEKKWNTGKIFASPGKYKQRNESPWWMREEIDRHPSALPRYEPWWTLKADIVNHEWSLEDLQKEATLRGISSQRSKAELIEMLNNELERNSLADDNFTEPEITTEDYSGFPYCYPEFYEASEKK